MCVYKRKGLLLRLTVLDRSSLIPVYIIHRIIYTVARGDGTLKVQQTNLS